jgi:hypothetical protein
VAIKCTALHGTARCAAGQHADGGVGMTCTAWCTACVASGSPLHLLPTHALQDVHAHAMHSPNPSRQLPRTRCPPMHRMPAAAAPHLLPVYVPQHVRAPVVRGDALQAGAAHAQRQAGLLRRVRKLLQGVESVVGVDLVGQLLVLGPRGPLQGQTKGRISRQLSGGRWQAGAASKQMITALPPSSFPTPCQTPLAPASQTRTPPPPPHTHTLACSR